MVKRFKCDTDDVNDSKGYEPKCQPDSCWSWLVCAASTVSIVIISGITYSFGLLLPPLIENFKETRQATGEITYKEKRLKELRHGFSIMNFSS